MVVRLSISVPDKLKAEMDQIDPRVNWSAVAQSAFAKEIALQKPNEVMEQGQEIPMQKINEPDSRKVLSARFKNENSDRGIHARLNINVTFPFEDFFIGELQRGTDPGKIVGAVIHHFGDMIGVTSINVTQGQKTQVTLLSAMRMCNEISIKAATTVMQQSGVKKKSILLASNENKDQKQ